MSLARGRVEVSGRLVGEDDVGVHGQGAGDGDALHLAAGELGRLVLHAVARPTRASSSAHALAPLPGRHAAEQQRQLHVLVGRDLRQQIEVLEDEADAAVADLGELVAGDARDVLAAEVVRSRVGVSRQPIRFISVDLPEPDGPTIATNSPRRTSGRCP